MVPYPQGWGGPGEGGQSIKLTLLITRRGGKNCENGATFGKNSITFGEVSVGGVACLFFLSVFHSLVKFIKGHKGTSF